MAIHFLEKTFTAKESLIVPLLAQGLPQKVIADKTGISIHTLRVHLDNIRRKCGNLSSAAECTAFLAKYFC
jgi:DNA-binding NarL/FixJ family response regulator